MDPGCRRWIRVVNGFGGNDDDSEGNDVSRATSDAEFNSSSDNSSTDEDKGVTLNNVGPRHRFVRLTAKAEAETETGKGKEKKAEKAAVVAREGGRPSVQGVTAIAIACARCRYSVLQLTEQI